MPRNFRIGTYNVENLFDRFDDPYSVGDDTYGRFNTQPKSRSHAFDVAQRIRDNGIGKNSVDIVALQELENFGALLDFVQASVGPDYGPKTGVVSLPSNDPRGIDLGLICTKLFRIGRIVSHRFDKFRRSDGKLYQFGRDCLQVEIVDKDRENLVLTAFICHFKSKYTGVDPFKDPGKYAKAQRNNTLKREAEARKVVDIVSSAMDIENDRFVVLGDLNDTPASEALAPLLADDNALGVTNAVSVIEQADTAENSPVRRPRDTHVWQRPKADGTREDEWAQIDYILCSKALWKLRTDKVDVLNSPKKQGSDHFFSYIEFEYPDFN
ncbi:endonuclease/exonuclease/phosphatase family protein [Lentilitoribacter sp. EG35]|jgi:endonuclease/exonuclease/phosphatase family metal-dependent hydrolase|uniref:endonuclease/exonuclease/phosphatase family protein n=1 Tax=Lentilitoribacter sp. EG35 TaxID=3234192 RepID=UPI00345FAD3B